MQKPLKYLASRSPPSRRHKLSGSDDEASVRHFQPSKSFAGACWVYNGYGLR